MSKNVAMFVDVANMYYAARGQDVDVDYVALLKHATKGRDLIRAYAYTGLDPENENQRKFIDFLAKNGYKPVVKDIRKFGDGRMKANLDIELVVDLFRLADRMDIAVIVSGDGDFAPAIRALQDKGVRCEVISFKPNTSSDLIAVADEFMDIMKVASISRKEGRAVRETGMSAPEMPAKEVTPEFGFREASPSVAAAALAALKGGGVADGTAGADADGHAAVAPAPRPAAAEPTASGRAAATAGPRRAADGDEEARRRRRRRGGRGRGRSRREDEARAGGRDRRAEEIGWEEFDDLSQLDGAGEEREYTFEEADAATLAELGLSPEAASARAAGRRRAATDEAPKPRAAARPAATDATPRRGGGHATRQPKPPAAADPRSRRPRTGAEAAATDEDAEAAAPLDPRTQGRRATAPRPPRRGAEAARRRSTRSTQRRRPRAERCGRRDGGTASPRASGAASARRASRAAPPADRPSSRTRKRPAREGRLSSCCAERLRLGDSRSTVS